jgi:(2R)-sulfolactate sulfo-lyase subunit alpha
MSHSFLVHNDGDHVGVAVRDIETGEDIEGLVMENGGRVSVTSKGAIPLGHKIALVELADGADVLKYQTKIGVTSQQILPGDYVHTHNIRSARW